MFGLVCVLCAAIGTSVGAEVTLQTSVGEIFGTDTNVFSLFTVRRFYGIPYAEAPIGDLRFRKPVPKARFTSTFNATVKGAVCHQQDIPGSTEGYEQSEDCLLLNVYTPADASPANKKPVMIWIHGGGFGTGSANDYDGELLSGFGDVVLVTINYRLFIHGFLSTGDSSLPGNLGLWDQHLAIQWVHDNIGSFGGDSNIVTVFGESAGSACVAHQTFHPGNMGLFHRAIAQSGGISDTWAYVTQDPIVNVHVIASDVGCINDTSADMIDCLRTIPNSQLLKSRALPLPLTPVFDNDFVRDFPNRLITGNTQAADAIEMFNSVDLLVGFTNADGLELIAEWMLLLGQDDFFNFTVSRQEFEDFIAPYSIQTYFHIDPEGKEAAIRAVIHDYTDFSDPDDDAKRIKKLIELATDIAFGVTSVATADLHTQAPNKTTYSYIFSVKPVARLLPIPNAFDGPDVMMHAEDILFVFGALIEYVAEPGNELYDVYRATMTMWTNFAKSGNPNTPNDVTQYMNIDWPEYGNSRNYIEIRVNPEPAKQNYRLKGLNFWSRLLPRALGICPDVNQMTEYVTVSTPVGDILGKEEYVPLSNTCGYRVQKFLGIPYAESPTGNLRFKKPVTKAAFTETFNATVEGDTCYQLNMPLLNEIYPRTEDCLLLNVYVPRDTTSNPNDMKAVMIWIHGGGFLFGQSNSYSDIGVLSGYGDVIVVTINYRLGMLGFLTTGDSSLPGNLGLWDQQLAIKWVHDNIAAFGGDPQRTTIFGQQNGAASVIYQCFYPGNMGLFQRAIAQSGTSDNVWAYEDVRKAVDYTRMVAKHFNCTIQSTAGFVQCLREKPINEIEALMNLQIQDFPLPVRDNQFVLDTPHNLIAGTTTANSALDMFNSVDLLMGVNNYDGMVDLVLNAVQLPITRDAFESTHIPHFLEMILGKQAPRDVELAAVHEYTDWHNLASDVARAHKTTDMLTDAFFAVNTIRTADQHLNSALNKTTYMYQFGVKPTVRYVALPDSLEGTDVASNGDELSFITGRGIQNITNDKMGQQQFTTYIAMMNMWSNFAKSGDPNRPENVTHIIQTTWPMYSSTRHFLDIKPEMASAKENFRSRAVNFWSNVVADSMEIEDRYESCVTDAGHSFRSHLSVVTLFLVTVSTFLL